MKIRTILCLVFFVSCIANAAIVSNPIVPPLADLEVCDNDSDGIAIFDLSVQTPIILAAQSTPASDYNVTYHLTLSNANVGFNAIFANSFMNNYNQQTIYVRVENVNTSEYSVGNFVLYVNATIIPIFAQVVPLCQGSTAPVLPTASANGIYGTWSPSTIDTSVLGTYIMTFTPDYGQCASTVTMAVTIAPSSTLNLVSSVATTNQTVCVNSAISNIVYVFGGNATGATITGLPASFSASTSGSTVTISGVASTSGFYPYTVTATGGCYQAMNGSITVSNASALTLVSPISTSNQTLCYNQPITNIVYQLSGGATGASVTGLPPGVTSSVTSSTLIISGTPSVSGQFNFTATTTGGCGIQSLTGTIITNPEPSITSSLLKVCDDDAQPNDGYTLFDIPGFIGSISGYSINYFIDSSLTQPITNPNSFVNTVADIQTIFLVITNVNTGCISYKTLTLQVLPIPAPNSNPSSISVCDINNDGFEIVDLTQNSNYILNGDTSLGLSYFYTLNDALSNTNEIINPNQASVSGDVWIKVFSNSFINYNGINCYSIIQQQIQLHSAPTIVGIGYSIVNNSGIQTLTVDTNGSGNYGYSIDGGPTQISPIFQNISLGNYTITITDLMYGCSTIINNIIVNLTTTPPPTGNTSQSFGSGATLANIQVSGQNIQWYSGANKSAAAGALPLNTLLVNGTTYYASQKIGGYESTSRLPVTAQVSLSNAQFELKGLTYAPNPVATNLSIKCNEIIDEVKVYNLLGQLVNETKALNSELQLDLSSLKSGNYFVKVSSGSSSSTFKIIKE
jgi:hypothetical protein